MLKHALVAAGVGAAYLVVRRCATRPLDPAVAAHAALAQDFPALAETLSDLRTLREDGLEALQERLLAQIAYVCDLDRKADATTPWLISRGCAEAVRTAEQLCGSVRPGASVDAYAEALRYRDEVLPQLQTHLDNLLHNHLQKRR